MATEITIGNSNKTNSIALLSKFETGSDTVNGAFFISSADVVVTISDDHSLRVWQKRDSGNYWPSIYHTFEGEAASVDYNVGNSRLYVGLSTGQIEHFVLKDDFNSIQPIRTLQSHRSRVSCLKYSLISEWVLSGSRDKTFQWHCSETGLRLGSYELQAWCTGLTFDESSKHAFVGDLSGIITMLKINDGTCSVITSLKGHSGSIRTLLWNSERKMLYSGSFDKSIIVWDIGGQQGTAYELQGHLDKVETLVYSSAHNCILSGGDDESIIVWNMNAHREETPEWVSADNCNICDTPFFWNVKNMWEKKAIGQRQHHCRKCGQAICGVCSTERVRLPILGFEIPVRVCKTCAFSMTDEEQKSLATFFEAKHKVKFMSLDPTMTRLMTVGDDKTCKIWDISNIW